MLRNTDKFCYMTCKLVPMMVRKHSSQQTLFIPPVGRQSDACSAIDFQVDLHRNMLHSVENLETLTNVFTVCGQSCSIVESWSVSKLCPKHKFGQESQERLRQQANLLEFKLLMANLVYICMKCAVFNLKPKSSNRSNVPMEFKLYWSLSPLSPDLPSSSRPDPETSDCAHKRYCICDRHKAVHTSGMCIPVV